MQQGWRTRGVRPQKYTLRGLEVRRSLDSCLLSPVSCLLSPVFCRHGGIRLPSHNACSSFAVLGRPPEPSMRRAFHLARRETKPSKRERREEGRQGGPRAAKKDKVKSTMITPLPSCLVYPQRCDRVYFHPCHGACLFFFLPDRLICRGSTENTGAPFALFFFFFFFFFSYFSVMGSGLLHSHLLTGLGSPFFFMSSPRTRFQLCRLGASSLYQVASRVCAACGRSTMGCEVSRKLWCRLAFFDDDSPFSSFHGCLAQLNEQQW